MEMHTLPQMLQRPFLKAQPVICLFKSRQYRRMVDVLWQYLALVWETLELHCMHFRAAYGWKRLPFAGTLLEPATPLRSLFSPMTRFPSFELVTLKGSGVASLVSFCGH
jgi:hypothetical protein